MPPGLAGAPCAVPSFGSFQCVLFPARTLDKDLCIATFFCASNRNSRHGQKIGSTSHTPTAKYGTEGRASSEPCEGSTPCLPRGICLVCSCIFASTCPTTISSWPNCRPPPAIGLGHGHNTPRRDAQRSRQDHRRLESMGAQKNHHLKWSGVVPQDHLNHRPPPLCLDSPVSPSPPPKEGDDGPWQPFRTNKKRAMPSRDAMRSAVKPAVPPTQSPPAAAPLAVPPPAATEARNRFTTPNGQGSTF